MGSFFSKLLVWRKAFLFHSFRERKGRRIIILFSLTFRSALQGRKEWHLTGKKWREGLSRHGFLFSRVAWGFPGGAVVGSLPANAGDTGSSPDLGGSHMPRSDWAREPRLLSLRVWGLCSATGEATMVRGPRTAMRSGPCLPQLEKALAQKRRPNTAKNK